MTENKRFTHNLAWDELTGIHDKGNNLSLFECCELMNSMNDENDKLKSFIKSLADNNGRIILINGYGRNIKEVINND